MWHAFLHLLARAVTVTVNEKGSTLLASCIGLAASLIQQIVALWQGKLMAKLKDWKAYIGVGLTIVAWAAVFLFAAAKIVYNDHKNLSAVAKQCDATQVKPDLQPEISEAGVAPAGDKDNAVIFVAGSIKNLGAPGNLGGLSLDVSFNDGRLFHIQTAVGGDQKAKFHLGKNAQGQDMSIPGSQYWFNEKAQVIQTFGYLSGWIAGIAKGVTPKEIRDKHATVVLTCADATGRKTSAQYTFGTAPPVKYEVGLEGLQKPLPTH